MKVSAWHTVGLVFGLFSRTFYIYIRVCYQTFDKEKVSASLHGVRTADPLAVQKGK